MMKTTRITAAARAGMAPLALAALLLTASACTSEPEAPAAPAAAADSVEGVAISNPRIVLNAVKGQPAVAYFDLVYTGTRGLTIRKAEVEGAGMTMMHDYGEYNGARQMMDALPVAITNGTEVSFQPGGLHIMAMDPPADWAPGGTAKVTLTMSGGATHSFDAPIRGPGEER